MEFLCSKPRKNYRLTVKTIFYFEITREGKSGHGIVSKSIKTFLFTTKFKDKSLQFVIFVALKIFVIKSLGEKVLNEGSRFSTFCLAF